MRVIIGLGNPGAEYADTRHNIGFMFIDKIKEIWNFSEWEFNKKFDAEIVKGNIEENEVILAKPQTFMNLSGDSVRAILDFYKLMPEDILVIQDDLDIAIGKYKVATDSSSAGHHGIEDIIEKIGTQKFRRIRVGIGEATNEGVIKCRLGAHDFVLGKFSEEEMEKIGNIEKDILEEVKKFLE